MENRDNPSVGFRPLGASGGTRREDEEKTEPPVGKVGKFHSGMEQPVSAGISNEFLPGIPARNSHRDWKGGEEEEGGMVAFQAVIP